MFARASPSEHRHRQVLRLVGDFETVAAADGRVARSRSSPNDDDRSRSSGRVAPGAASGGMCPAPAVSMPFEACTSHSMAIVLSQMQVLLGETGAAKEATATSHRTRRYRRRPPGGLGRAVLFSRTRDCSLGDQPKSTPGRRQRLRLCGYGRLLWYGRIPRGRPRGGEEPTTLQGKCRCTPRGHPRSGHRR